MKATDDAEKPSTTINLKRGQGAARPRADELAEFARLYDEEMARSQLGTPTRLATRTGMNRTTVYRWIDYCRGRGLIAGRGEESPHRPAKVRWANSRRDSESWDVCRECRESWPCSYERARTLDLSDLDLDDFEFDAPPAPQDRTHAIPDPRDKPWMTVAEVAIITGEGEKAIRAALDAGHLPLLQVGRYKRIPTSALRKLVGIPEVD